MFERFKKKEEVMKPFGTGIARSLTAVPDQVFSQKMMGDGYALELTEGTITAPVSGEVTMIFPTGHAFGITTDAGLELLIHIGIDTVELKGEGFDAVVKQGDKVKQGDVLTHVDLEFIKAQGKSLISPFIFTSGQSIVLHKEDEMVDPSTDQLLTIQK
ncbi:PTS glucose transporter subunit IIA [Erysipelothrix rhusiopathiae]|uniref:PTS system, glucose subfamily, IIA component n=1 Tax=Erysipelothrix rhusiopathiae ATCC 19414 TaxID=525280 RepID=E7FXT9_ERYRH|nr:PTS glucose transporter subunit IIA [Erysipelothrix rhusiopathiae]UPU40027.1 PTS glucose transporter subunit IIA [Erysipelothrix sp. Poltava]EFY08313.1 PTS system, glucose subfamily, IIA component [Erysipelothrix rhusiopathiae ATCC 19414]MDE8339338.1 PTS glucose transporter subunit IIA [Erysipelothrix rhusiopathiae]MDV7680718.1 PTS glucose transporter subunit IIA [Erysipelothrix rhusiopathiae]VEH83873.1 Glucose-specific phosphotransferase enzyme IIA component [Erysipelothrix rhusiopathiae]